MGMDMVFFGGGFTKAQEELLSTLTEVSSWATLAGSSFILISYLAFKEIRHFHLRLIFFLAIADFLTSVVFILNLYIDISQKLPCTILAAILQFSEISSTLWAFCIAFTLDQVIRVCNYHVERFEKYFHLIAVGIPIITTILAGVQGLYVNTGLWCWVSNRGRGLYRWLYFYGPLVIILFYVVTIYFLVSRKIRSQMRLSMHVYQHNSETTIQQTFRWYIIGWAICWVPALVDRVQGMMYPDNPIYVLSAMHAFFTPLAGFCNSIAIGFNDEIQAQYAALFWRFGLRFKKPSTKSSSINQETKLIQEIMKEYDNTEQ